MILTDKNFETTLKRAEKPVLLLFMSSACGPSYALQLIMDDCAESFQHEFELAEIDIEASPNITRHFQIKGTPTLMILDKDEPVASRIGTQSPKHLLDWLAAYSNLPG